MPAENLCVLNFMYSSRSRHCDLRTRWGQCLLIYNFYINSCSEQPDDRERVDVTTSSRVTVSHKRKLWQMNVISDTRTSCKCNMCISLYFYSKKWLRLLCLRVRMSPVTSPGVRCSRGAGGGSRACGERRSLTLVTSEHVLAPRARTARRPVLFRKSAAVSLGGFPGRGVHLFTYLGGPDRSACCTSI